MRIYLAARYSRRLELCDYRDHLRALGHTVQAVWLDGKHQLSNEGVPIGDHGENLVEGRFPQEEYTERSAALRNRFAHDDFRDVISAELTICFTEPPRSDKGRGGRHVEMGIALGRMQHVWVVGPRENIFCWLDDVRHFDDWAQAVAALPLAIRATSREGKVTNANP